MSKKERGSTGRKRKLKDDSCLFQIAADEDASFENALSSVAKMLKDKKNVVVLTGAGISVSSGIPDFRSKNVGIYETLNMEELGLSCPEELFDWQFFQEDPVPFYKFARQLYFPNSKGYDDPKSRRVQPSDAHKLLALLDRQKKLLRCYSQNIDGLEQQAGVSSKQIVYTHGSLEWGVCLECKRKTSRSEMEEDVWEGKVARCRAILSNNNGRNLPSKIKAIHQRSSDRTSRNRPNGSVLSEKEGGEGIRTRGVSRKECTCGGVLKPGITFFGETLGENVRRALEADHNKADAIIVIGTSLSVAPISKVIGYLPPKIPRILINRAIVHPPKPEQIIEDAEYASDQKDDFRKGYVFDAYLLGFCDDISRALWKALSDQPSDSEPGGALLSALTSSNIKRIDDGRDAHLFQDWSSVSVPHNRVLLFNGAIAPTKQPEDEEFSYHEVANCDNCSMRIQGTIKTCVSCFNYDLCEACYKKTQRTHFNGKHTFSSEKAA